MKIKWYGHASFLITSEEGATIITDPYEPGAYDGGIAYKPIEDAAEVVTVSHDHADHNYVQGIKGSPVVIKGPGIHKAAGITFKGIATYHDTTQGSERGGNTIFVFTVDGVTVCHAGDLGHQLAENTIRELGAIDILFLPIGGVYTLDPAGATEVANALHPRLLIPMHFKTPRCGFPLARVEEFLEGKSSVEKTGKSEITATKDNLPDAMHIIVLEPAN